MTKPAEPTIITTQTTSLQSFAEIPISAEVIIPVTASAGIGIWFEIRSGLSEAN
jgi:hypothetical protein